MPKKFTFRSGVHPSHCKSQTEHLKIENFPAPPKVVIPLSQHIGKHAGAIVDKGDRVIVGQLIGESAGNISAAIHSSVAGTVLSVRPFAHPSGHLVNSIEIENDGSDETLRIEPIGQAWRETAPGELIQEIAACGIVGLGGAGFPTHIKLSPPAHKPVNTLIINGAECEPYLTDDHRLMVERTSDILTGAHIIKKILGASNICFGIEDNKIDAIYSVSNKIAAAPFNDISLFVLKSKYPQGDEKLLITAITKRKVPSGKLPMDVGCVVLNVSTVLAVHEAIMHGTPLYERVVTVMGECVKTPKNLLVRVGTPVRALLEACNTDMDAAKKIIMGGPMMGQALSDIEVPIIKTASGILVTNRITEPEKKHPCINCGVCVRVCPIKLIPSRLAKFIDKGNFDEAVKWNLSDCIECGSCAYMCPAKINLVQFYRLGKLKVLEMKTAHKKICIAVDKV